MGNEEITASESEENNAKQNITSEQYKLFGYLKEHPAFFVTVVSFVLAVVTFLCQFLNITVIRIYLQSWNIGTLLVGPAIRNDTFYYYAIFSLIYFFVLCVLSDSLKSFYSDYFCDVVFLNYCREFHKLSLRLLREQEKELAKIRRTKRRDHSDYGKEIRRLEKKISKDSKLLEETKQLIHNHRRTLRKVVMGKLGFCLLLLLIPATLQMLSFGRTTFVGLVVSWGVYAISFVLPNRYFSKKIYREYSRKRIVSDINKAMDKNRFEEFFMSLPESISENKPPKADLSERFIDRNIPNLITDVFAGMVFMIITVLTVGVLLLNTDIFNKNITCYTWQSDDKNYAVIYQNDSIYYLEEAEEVNGDLIIDLSSQRILKSDNLSLKLKKYNKVIKTGYIGKS